MEKDRKDLWEYLSTKKDPDTKDYHTKLNYSDFDKKWFQNEIGFKKNYDYCVDKKLWTGTTEGFYQKYGCDLSWATNNTNCKSCKKIDKKYIDKDYDMTLDVEVFRRAKNKGIYYTAYYDCKTDGKKHYF